MRIYAGMETGLNGIEEHKIALQSIPYDGTSTWGEGSRQGFAEFLDASDNMEIFDIETSSEVYKEGVFILPEITESASPESLYQAVLEKTKMLLETGMFLTFFGGEHSISIGIIEAFREKYHYLTVLQLDAHADLRREYNGSEYNHACAMHKANLTTNLVQVGIRSMDICENEYLKPGNCFFAEQMYGKDDWIDRSIDRMTDSVYITIDLDVLDPSIMPSTGTPEPGGLDWNTLITYLARVFSTRNVVGFDIVEFAPLDNFKAPGFLVAKLYYKMLSYKFSYGR